VTAPLGLSVVVASHDRPRALRRCLIGLHQLAYPQVELVVVADAAGRGAIADLPFAGRVIVLDQAEPNLSRARNAGAAAAGGDVIAFIDDDAVPEPTWAGALAEAFAVPDLQRQPARFWGATGYRCNGGGWAVDACGRDLRLDGGEPPAGAALKLHGTNMAIRRAALQAAGGFDAAFGFYLDDTDLALRLSQGGGRAAYLPGAVVHHSFAASPRRRADRAPLSLFDIGASSAVFLRKHAPDDLEDMLGRLRQDQADRLQALRRRGRLTGGGVASLLAGLDDGIAAGRERPFGTRAEIAPPVPFRPVRDAPPPAMTMRAGWTWQAGHLRRDRPGDDPFSLFLFEPTPRKHKVVFTEDGIWEQCGGLYGPSRRDQPRLQPWRFGPRVAAEVARVAALRGLTATGDDPGRAW